jgi:hypothetical protein
MCADKRIILTFDSKNLALFGRRWFLRSRAEGYLASMPTSKLRQPYGRSEVPLPDLENCKRPLNSVFNPGDGLAGAQSDERTADRTQH